MPLRASYATITPVGGDYISVTDDPGGTALTRNCTFTALATYLDTQAAYAVMSVQGASSAETTTDGTPRKVAAWTTDGVEQNMTADSTTGKDITADVAGTFLVSCGVSFSGTASKTFLIEIYLNGSATGFAAERKLGAGGDVGRVAIVGIVAASATDRFQLYQWSSDAGSSLTITEATMAAVRISD